MIRVRFLANAKDPRPVNWPVEYPFWISGYAGDDSFAIVISYANNEKYIYKNWPEAENLDIEKVDKIVFTDRFPQPDWYTVRPRSRVKGIS